MKLYSKNAINEYFHKITRKIEVKIPEIGKKGKTFPLKTSIIGVTPLKNN